MVGVYCVPNKEGYVVKMDKRFKEMASVVFGPVGASTLLARCPAPPGIGQPFMEGAVLLRAEDGTLATQSFQDGQLAVMLGVFDVRDTLVCVVLAIVGEQYFPIYVNLRNEREAAPLRAMAKQGFAMLAVFDGTTGMAIGKHRPPSNIFAQPFELLEEFEPWTEAQYRDARRAFELSFEDDLEGLAEAILSDANGAYPRSLLGMASCTGVHEQRASS